MKLPLTADQSAQLQDAWKEATSAGCGHVLAGQVLQHQHPHPEAGSLYLSFSLIRRPVAEAMRKAFTKAQSKPLKTK